MKKRFVRQQGTAMRGMTIWLGVVFGITQFSASASDSYFTRAGTPGWWGDEANWDTMPDETTETIMFYKNDGSPLEAYLRDGDNFSHTNASLTVGCKNRSGSSITTVRVTIPTNSCLRVKKLYSGSDVATGVVDVVGGTLKVDGEFKFGSCGTINVVGGTMKGSAILGAYGSGTIRVKDGEVGTLNTFGWTGKGVVEADNSIVRVGSGWIGGNGNYGSYVLLKNGSTLISSGGIGLGTNVDSAQCDLYAEDSLIDLGGALNFSQGRQSKLMLTNSTIRATKFNNSNSGRYIRGADKPAYVEQIGASSNIFSDAIMAGGNFRYLLDGEKAYLEGTKLALSTLADSVTQRFDFVSGKINLTGGDGLSLSGTGKVNFYQKGGTLAAKQIVFGGDTSGLTKRYDFLGGKIDLTSATSGCLTSSGGAGVFSIRGSAPELTLPKVAESASVLLEYVIDRTGTPCIQFVPAGISANNWMKGTHVVKLDGGVQLLHTNTIAFVDTQAKTALYACGTGAPGETDYGKGSYYDLNQAEHHLWTFGPHTNPSSHPIGVLAGSTCFGAQLNAEEQFERGKCYDEVGDERSCGWILLPKFKTKPIHCRVLLAVEPQGEHTLQEIAEGLTAAGYTTKLLQGNYNLQVSIPVDDLHLDSTTEIIAFDFADYATPTAVKSMTPSDVRAFVRQLDVDTGRIGTMFIFR